VREQARRAGDTEQATSDILSATAIEVPAWGKKRSMTS
jgi:hypothetical protein